MFYNKLFLDCIAEAVKYEFLVASRVMQVHISILLNLYVVKEKFNDSPVNVTLFNYNYHQTSLHEQPVIVYIILVAFG